MQTLDEQLDRAAELCRKGNFDAGKQVYLSIFREYPQNSRVIANLGALELQAGNYSIAIEYLRSSLLIDDEKFPVHYNLGRCYQSLNCYSEAIDCYKKTIRLNESFTEAHNALGIAYKGLKNFELALKSFNRAIAINSKFSDAFNNRGVIYKELRKYQSALHDFERALELNPGSVEALNNIGLVLNRLGKFDKAEEVYKAAIAINPDFAVAYKGLGDTYVNEKKYELSIASYSKAIELDPNLDFAQGSLIHSKSNLCEWSGMSESIANLVYKIVENKNIYDPFIPLTVIDSQELHYKNARNYAKRIFSNPLDMSQTYHSRRGKIRVGYFSPDFKEHPVAYLTTELFEKHDRSKFEIIAFSFVSSEISPNSRLRKAFDKFIQVDEKSDQEIVNLAREMQIDIAIDLAGYTNGSRPDIFELRAAPIQINFLGYPSTMGADFIDYLVADRNLIAPDEEAMYSEEIIYMPDCFMPHDSSIDFSKKQFSRSDFGLPENAFVFCCFNASYKITPEIFKVWMSILKDINHSVLWLSDMNKIAKTNLKCQCGDLNIDPDRLIFAPRMAKIEEHLSRISLADLFLDTFPYNAHTTANDALRAGLPLLTLRGDSFASRVGSSLLNSLGLEDLITKSLDDYAFRAKEIANNSDYLLSIRSRLSYSLKTSRVFNMAVYVNDFERVLRNVYDLSKDG